MCGRYTLFSQFQAVASHFGLINTVDFPPLFNAAPMQNLPIVIENRIGLVRWGLMPAWGRGKSDIKPQINARIETVKDKPFFRDSFESRRCLVPANGFYEWQKMTGGKQPWYFSDENRLLAFAGIYNKDGFCIITRPAAEPVAEIHGRMPVIVPPEDYAHWMNGDSKNAQDILDRIAPPMLYSVAVSYAVNKTTNNHENLIKKAQPF